MNSAIPIKLALDINGGDFGSEVMISAACDAVKSQSNLEITLVGDQFDWDRQTVSIDDNCKSRINFEQSSTVLKSGVGPVTALRAGNTSSMGRSVELVANGTADACISAGSTTALMALGVRMLGLPEGLMRPALMARIPSSKGFTSLLDLGANLNVEAPVLVQFAIMGAIATGRSGMQECSVGLLNVGHEDTKGSSVVKIAHEMLKNLPLNYKGFIEGDDIYSGTVDVAVCDGFTGNLILKSGEGLARMLFSELEKGLNTNWTSRAGALLARPALRTALARFEPAQHNGAPLLGLNGVVIKSHGSANRAATLHAILEARKQVGNQVPGQIQKLIAEYEASKEA